MNSWKLREDVHLTLPSQIFPSKLKEHVTSRVSGGEFKTK